MDISYGSSSELSGFWVTGEDALNFLQGQSTPDLRKITLGGAVFGAFLDPKGRVIANGWFARDQKGYLIVLAKDLREEILTRLGRYVLRSKVSFERLPEDLPLWIGHVDPSLRNEESLNSVSLESPFGRDETGFRIHFPKGLLILGADESLFPSGSQRLHGSIERLLLVKAGIPLVLKQTKEKFIPQMLEMEWLGGLSFDKGCYVGQEIVTRTKFLGEVKRHLYRFAMDIGEAEVGADITHGTNNDVIGTVLLSAPLANGGCVGLGVIKNQEEKNNLIRIHGIPCYYAPFEKTR